MFDGSLAPTFEDSFTQPARRNPEAPAAPRLKTNTRVSYFTFKLRARTLSKFESVELRNHYRVNELFRNISLGASLCDKNVPNVV